MAHFHFENAQPGNEEAVRSERPPGGMDAGRVVRELNKPPDERLVGSEPRREPEGPVEKGPSTLPFRNKPRDVEHNYKFSSTSPRTEERIHQTFGTPVFVGTPDAPAHPRSGTPRSRGVSEFEPTAKKHAQSPEPSPSGEKNKPDKEEHARGEKPRKAKGSKIHLDQDDDNKVKNRADRSDRDESDRDFRIADRLPRDRFREPRVSAYVEGQGTRSPLQDPQLNDMGRGILNAQRFNDNFHLMKAIRGLSDIDTRLEFEKAQSVINRDLGHASIRLGVDAENIHAYFKGTDLALPYDPSVDAKLHLDVNDPSVRKELETRLQTDVKDLWNVDLKGLSTSELALFDAISRSDGPALRSAMHGIKTAEELDTQFEHIADFCFSHGVTDWGDIVWKGGLRGLVVKNGVPLYSGRFPIDDGGDPDRRDDEPRLSNADR